MKRGWVRYLAVVSGVAIGLTTNPAPVLADGNALVHLHKTVDATLVSITPSLGLSLGVDKASAVPGDTLTYTAVVTNPTATLGMGGAINAQASGAADAVVTYYWDEVQYCAVGCGVGYPDPNWTALVASENVTAGYTPAITPAVHSGLVFNAVNIARSGVTYPTSGDPILGTDIMPNDTGGWSYLSSAVLTPAQVAILSDPGQAQFIRNVLHFELRQRNSTANQPFTDPEIFSNPFLATSHPAAVTNVTVTFTLPDGSTTSVGPAQVPGLASLNPGASATATAAYKVPAPAPRGTSETESAYVTRLRSIDGSALSASAGATGTGFSGTVSASASPVTTNEFVPIVTIGKSGPAQVDAGTSESNPLTLQNGGSATATSIAIVDTVPGGTNGTVTGAPATLAGGGSGTATAAYAVPSSQAAGDLTDTAAVTWKDANGNPYGPLSSSFTTQVRNILFGARLTLAPASAGPNVPGTTQTLTATLVDQNGNPIANQVVKFTITGANPGSGTGTTDASGNATFTYTGSNQGSDQAQATVNAPAITITSNTSTVTWLKLIQPVATTVVQGNFYANPSGLCHFGADATTTPVFSQSFPNIMFNPDPAIFKVQPPFLRPDSNGNIPNNFIRPFTDVTTDLNGNPNGTIIASANGFAAGVNPQSFFASFTGSFVVGQPGDVTFRILHSDGYLFGVASPATRVSGDFEGDVVPSTMPINGYPTDAAWNTSSSGSSSSGPATIHFPAAGVYPFELDYADCGGPLFLDLLTEKFVAQTSPLSIYVGYADGLRQAGSIFPFPWAGSPNVTFEGCPLPCQFDGGAIRIDNSGTQPAQIDSVTVDIPFATGVSDCPGVTHFDIWPHNLTIPAGQILILAPVAPGNTCSGPQPFDTSDTSFYCGPDTGVIPVLNLTSGGVTTSFNDTTQVLNTGGRDQADCGGNESISWQRIGGGGTAVNLPLPPAAALNLTPFNVPDAVQGQSITETVSALDGAGNPVPSLPVTLSVFGPNAQTQTASTGANGLVTFTFNGNLSGTDTVQASAFVEGLRAVSNTGTVIWTPTGGTNNPLGPSITSPTPADGSVITKPTPVDATIVPPSGNTITSWRVFYQAAAGGSQVVIGSGTGSPPSPLGVTFDPTLIADGVYRLVVEATASDGAIQDVVSGVAVIGGLKLGRYSTTFQDLSVPVNGFQMSVLRTYDSTDGSNGDFGVGWRVDVSNFRVSSNHILGAGGWTQYNTSCTLGLCFTGFKNSAPRFITVVYPDQHTEIFDFAPTGGTNLFWACAPVFKARSAVGATSTLIPLDDTGCSYNGDGNLYGTGGHVYNPQRFQLTTRSGQVLVLDTTHGLVSMTDRSGNTVTVDANGVHSSNGQSITFTRDGSGRITQATDPAGETVRYAYSSAGDLASSTDPLGNTDSYTYDSSHRLLAISGPQGPLSMESYDSNGRLISITDAVGHVTQIANDPGTQTAVYSDGLGATTTVFTSDDLGDVVREDVISGGVTQTTRFTYDSVGRITSKTDAVGATTSAEYDSAGDPISYTDARGNVTHLTYDSFGQLTSVVGPGSTTLQSSTYDSNGNLVSMLGQDGSVVHFAYDSEGRPTSRTDATGDSVSMVYDAAGHVTQVTDATSGTTAFTRDADGRILTSTDPLGGVTHYSYDSAGDLVGLTDALGVSQTFSYNSLGLVTSTVDALGKTTSLQYDADGNVTKTVDREGRTTSYSYDADGRLIRIDYAGGDFQTYTLDGFNRPIKSANSTSSVESTYDAAGHLLSSTTHAAAFGAVTISYTYDAAGNRLTSTGPDGTVRYAYDALNRVSSVTDPKGGVFSVQYDSASNMTALTRPNGVADAYVYNADGRLTGITSTSGSTTIQALGQTVNPNGQVASRTDATGTTTYVHDADGRLVGVTTPGSGAQSYAYDAVGNRLSGPSSTSSTYNASDQLMSDANFTYTYDAEGGRTSKTDKVSGLTTNYVYNSQHQLVAIDYPDGTSTTYTYDPLGRRITATSGATTTAYVYDGVNTRLEYDSGTLAASFVGAGQVDHPLEMTRGGNSYYYLQDLQGSVSKLTDSTGSVAASYSYDAFGVPTGTAPPIPNPFTYNGREYDPKSGLYYNRARYYEPSTGSFLGSDPLASGPPYAYAGNDPVDFNDPSGALFAEIAAKYASLAKDANNWKLFGCTLGFFASIIEISLNLATQVPITSPGLLALGTGLALGCAFSSLGASPQSGLALITLPLIAGFVAALVDYEIQVNCAIKNRNPGSVSATHVIAVGLAALAISGGAAVIGSFEPVEGSAGWLTAQLVGTLAAGIGAEVFDKTAPNGACG